MSKTLALVFPGQGSQSVGMLAELAGAWPVVREAFEEASDGAGMDLWRLSQEGPEERLNQTECTQPALLAADVAVWRVWQHCGGPRPAVLGGHSLGEYAALVAAGALSLADGARLVRERGRLMQTAVPAGAGAMAAVLGAEDQDVEAVCAEVAAPEVAVPANYNAPGQIVIGGTAAGVDAALAALAARGVRKAVRLAVSVPSHTPLMREAARRLEAVLDEVHWSEPELPVVRNVDGALHEGLASIRAALVAQIHQPVRWVDGVRTLAARGVTAVGECGPGKVLTGLVKRIDRQLDARALGTPAELEAALEAWSTP